MHFPTTVGRSADDRRLILELWRASEEFRSLCADLGLARRAERFWSHRAAPEAEARRAEYRALVEALEREIHERVEAETK